MTITKVSYQKTYPTAPYENEKIGMEATIDEDYETVSESIEKLKKHCDEIHKKNNPQLYQEQETTIPYTKEKIEEIHNGTGAYYPNEIQPQPLKKLSQKELITNEITNAKTLKALSEWKLLSDKYPDLKQIFEEKLKELTK